MRKWIAVTLLMGVPLAGLCVSGPQTLVNEPGLTYANQYPTNLDQYGSPQGVARNISTQITTATDTFTVGTFTDGTQSTTSITVTNLTSLFAKSATEQITVPTTAQLTPSKATDYFQITSVTGLTNAIFYFNGTPLINGRDWFDLGASSAATRSICDLISTGFSAVQSTMTYGQTICYSTATVGGSAGNLFTLASSTPTALKVGGPTFAGGKDSVLLDGYVTINGSNYRTGYHWQDTGLSSSTALSLATFLQGAFSTVFVSTITPGQSIIYATATVAGTAANAITVTGSTAAIVIGAPTFTGGQDAASITVNGKTLTNGVDWSTGTTTTITAANIAAAMNADATIGAIVKSTNVAGVVVSTSVANGVAANYVVSSSTTALKFANPTMTGGTDLGYNNVTDKITIANHGFTKALPVLYSTSSGVGIGGLTALATYYVIVVDANNIQLSTGSTAAQQGVFINITSSSTQTTGHSYTLAPLTIAGASGGRWEASNDGTNWATLLFNANGVAISSQTYVAAPTTTIQDLGVVNFQWLRYNVQAPGQGALNLKVILNAKD